jgi:hypothetical protein
MAASRWKFQIMPYQRDVVARGFRMDAVGEAVEREVNEALPYPFKFHKVNKIVICLGPAPADEKDLSWCDRRILDDAAEPARSERQSSHLPGHGGKLSANEGLRRDESRCPACIP